MKYYFGAAIFIITFNSIAQERKELTAKRVDISVKLDGVLTEAFWETVPIATDFKMLQPDNGPSAPESHRTEVKIAYNDEAIYIGAYLYDNAPQTILKEYSQRDNIFVEADVFTVAINTFNDGINENKFYVTAAGTQADSKTLQSSRRSNDFNWSAVWESAISITNKGWTVEMKIPYAALRFQNSDTQTWGINFLRDIKKRNEIYSWNLVDRTIGRESQYNGILRGITNIKPPMRLSFFPFVSVEYKTTKGNSIDQINTGLDIKYGISENFTLDATLIPDFSQVGFDPVSLNLGPFEQTFREQRQFFTEGVELFNKGRIFFSRRIGGRPSGFAYLSENEEIINKPKEVKVLNVFKISGRTKKGLGIGFLNAITEKTEATLLNTETNIQRKETIEPFTNYNVLVLDQQFNNNSSVSFINTNVIRNGRFRDANVSALVYDISTKSNSYNLSGDFKYSMINDTENENGFSGGIDFRKASGNFRYSVGYFMADTKFDINDLGRQRRNNYSDFFGDISYEKFTPKGRFNNYDFSLFASIRNLYKPHIFTSADIGVNASFVTKKQLSYDFNARVNPSRSFDYFEPRTPGRFLKRNPRFFWNSDFSTDGGRRLSSDFTFRTLQRFNDPERNYSFAIRPQFRLTNKFKINYSIDGAYNKSEPGFVTTTDTDIIFGRRDIKKIENSVRFAYNHNNNHAINLNFRNLWTTVQYKNRFFILEQNGNLVETNQTLDFNPDTNFNVWNLDLTYSWQFAPGSQAVFLYRNTIFQNTDNSALNYLESLNDLLKQPITHIFSIKITYFLDYLNVKKIFRKKNA